MGHERYAAGQEITGSRPVDELARRLISAGGIEKVHVYSNMVTVDLAPGANARALPEVITGLFTYYREGVEVADPMAGTGAEPMASTDA